MNGAHDRGGTDGLGPVPTQYYERTNAVLATARTTNHHEAHREPVAVDPAR
jgi:hypothetical protein